MYYFFLSFVVLYTMKKKMIKYIITYKHNYQYIIKTKTYRYKRHICNRSCVYLLVVCKAKPTPIKLCAPYQATYKWPDLISYIAWVRNILYHNMCRLFNLYNSGCKDNLYLARLGQNKNLIIYEKYNFRIFGCTSFHLVMY